MTTTTTTNPSVRDYARAYAAAKPEARSAIVTAVAQRAAVSARKRWGNLLRAMQAGDTARVAAYAAEGDAKKAAWNAVRAATPAPALAFTAPKAAKAAKPKAKATRKAAPAKPKADLSANALVAQLAGMDDAAFASFFNALVAARAK